MTIDETRSDSTLTLAVSGRLDTTTAPELEEKISSSFDGVTELILDLGGLAYISSAGLRVLLATQKAMKGRGTMVVRNVPDVVMEVFDITGFTDILTIQ